MKFPAYCLTLVLACSMGNLPMAADVDKPTGQATSPTAVNNGTETPVLSPTGPDQSFIDRAGIAVATGIATTKLALAQSGSKTVRA